MAIDTGEHTGAKHLELDFDEPLQRRQVVAQDLERQHRGRDTGLARGTERLQQREIVAGIGLIGTTWYREPCCGEPVELAHFDAAFDELGAGERARAAMLREHAGDRGRGGELVRRCVDRALDQIEREELALLELLDRANARDDPRVVPGHRPPGLLGRDDQAFAQVMLERRDRDAGAFRELGDLQQRFHPLESRTF